MEVEHYIDGQHNGGVYSSFNHNTYMYCLQNPVIYIDPNGKQEKSSYSFTKGFFKGLWDAGTAIGGIKSQIETTVHVAKTSYKIITNQQVQKQFVEGVKVIANDPGGSLSKVGNSIVEGIKNNPEAQGQIAGALVAGLSDLGIGAATSTAKGGKVLTNTLKATESALVLRNASKVEDLAAANKIMSLQDGLSNQKYVEQIYNNMVKGDIDVTGKLGAFVDNGVTYVNEGSHHMAAALLYQTETGSNKYVELLLNTKSSVNKKPESKVYNFSVKLD